MPDNSSVCLCCVLRSFYVPSRNLIGNDAMKGVVVMKSTTESNVTVMEFLLSFRDSKSNNVNDYNLTFFLLLIVKLFAKNSNGAFHSCLMEYVKSEMFDYCTARACHNNPATIYLEFRLIKSIYNDYLDVTGNVQPLSEFLSYFDGINLQLTEKLKDYAPYKNMNTNQKFLYRRCAIKSVLNSYSLFINERNRRYKKIYALDEGRNFTDYYSPYSRPASLTFYNTVFFNKITEVFLGLNVPLNKMELSTVYVKIIKTELDFWYNVINENYSSESWKCAAVTGLYYYNLLVIEAEADRALAKGDTERAMQLYKMFLEVSDEYREIKDIARSYAYASVKGKLKKLERMQSKDNSKNSNPRVS